MSLQVARPVDKLERYNVTRSNLNIYHNVLVGNRIHSPHLAKYSLSSVQEWAQLLLDPITQLLEQHPSLGLVVGDHLTAKPMFLYLKSIDLLSLIRVVPIKTALQVDHIIEEEHNLPFDLSDQSIPLWRLVITPTEDDPSTFYLLYTFHHVIGDGRSAMAITKQFVEQLNLQQDRFDHRNPSLPGSALQMSITSHKPIPASLESRINCYPSMRTLIYEASRVLFLPGFVKKALEPRYWAGEMDSSLEVPNKTELAYLQFSQEDTSSIIRAAKRRSTTVQSVLYAAAVFAVKLVFMSNASSLSLSPSSASSSSDNDKHSNDKQEETIVFATPVSLRSLISKPIAPEDQGNYTSEILHRKIRVRNESSFWTMAHAYRQQVVRATTTPSGLRGLLEHVGMLSLLPKQDGAWEKFMANQVKRDQHGRKATIKVSNLGCGWDSSRPRDGQGCQEESTRILGFSVKDAIFSQSSGVTASALTMNVATANGVMTMTTTWQKATFQGRARGDLFMREFKRILSEALDDAREEYSFSEAASYSAIV
ncbi:MAG: alcohol acetyltransferase [Benniella sp.]|nr:MAG: alcohol acetyltransferase [Benniella sp.]